MSEAVLNVPEEIRAVLCVISPEGNIIPVKANAEGIISTLAEFTGVVTSKLTHIGDQALTPRDWSLDFEKLQNIDVPTSSLVRLRVYEQTFEDGGTDTTADNCTQEIQSSVVYGGSYALKVTIPAGVTGTVTTPSRPVSPNQRVTFAFAHKEEGDITSVKLDVIWLRKTGGVISIEEFELTPSTSWQVDSRTVTAPNQAASMQLRMQATAGSSGGIVYLDEMTIDLAGQILRVDGAGNVMVSVENTPLDVSVTNTPLDVAVNNLPSEFPLPADQVADLKNITGSVSVTNLPSNYPLPASQVTDLKMVSVENTPLDVSVTNFPTDYPDTATHTRLDSIISALASLATEATLSSIDSKIITCDTSNISGSVNVLNFPAEYPLPSAQVSDLKQVTVTNTPLDVNVTNTSLTVSGDVNVLNFPTEYPLPETQISDLKNVAITNTPLDVTVTNTSITISGDVSVNNFPSDYPDSTAHTKLDTINATLQSELTRVVKVQYFDGVDWVDWDKSVSVDNLPSEYPLPASQITELKSVTITNSSITVEGTVSVGNFPTEYPLPSTQVSDLKQVTVTNTPLDVNVVSGSITVGSVEVSNFPTEYPLPSSQVSDLKTVTVEGLSIAYDSANDVIKVALPYDARERAWNLNSASDSVSVEGSVDVNNFPTEYPLPATQVSDLKNITIAGMSIAYDDVNDQIKVVLPYDARDRNWNLSSAKDSVSVTGNVNVGNFPSDFPDSTTHSKLDTANSTLNAINAKITKCDTDNISGSVSVNNLPSTYPLPDTQADEDTYFTGYVWDSSSSQFLRIEGYISNAQYGYDSNGNLTSETLTITDASGTVIATIQKTYTYDASGNLVGESRWEKI
ncbi:MAG: RHS repeat domain-containing protein [Candidatus Methanospirareceae archaeon]